MRSRTSLRLVVATALFLGLIGTSSAAGSPSFSGLAAGGPPSFAGSAGAAQYSQPTIQNAPTLGSSVQTVSTQAVSTQQAAPSGGGLPRTGYAAVAVLLAGIGLAAGGLFLRRFSRQLPGRAA